MRVQELGLVQELDLVQELEQALEDSQGLNLLLLQLGKQNQKNLN
jgi:hypothetical protein